MAAPRTLLALFLLVVSFSCAYTDYCPSMYDGSSFTQSFYCPRSGQSWDWSYCCDEYTTGQHCCDYSDYYGYWDTGTIVGVSFGGVIGVSILVTLLIVCCVCAGRRPMPRPPVVLSTVQTVPAPQQGALGVSHCAPPAYNEVVQHPPPKVGQYQQLTNQPGYPIDY
ncbi:uncharacterized protein LOC119743559 [Patiria miniata]|uniref:Uncharacterized protein n=1 Tax=Patiria miniata TaxID=46514 RepID=A0A914BII2_PATMI|nr:uncharacterized protein LOC119743559 [Patiria miniata]